MQWLKTVFAYQKRLYCSKAWQRIMPGGSRDKEGKKLFSIGKWGDAEEYYDLLLAKYPNRVLFLERAAFVKQTRGNIVAAESILSDLVSLYPEVPRFTIRLSNILLEKKRSQEAINILARALLYSPKSIKLMIFLIKASSLLENWDKEKDVFLRCLEKSRNNKSLLIDYLARCRENNDIEAIKAVKHGSAIKDYFLNDHCLNEKTKEEIFGGFPHFSNEYFSKIQIHPGLQLARRSVRMADYENEYVAVKNGIRRTVGVPPTYDKTIYLIGASRLYGSYCEDSHTIASYLQSLFNSCPGENVRVMNLGVDGQRHHNAFLCIMAEQPRKGDIVLFFPPPNVYHSQFQTDAFNEDFRYYRAMREFCARAGAFFHIVFFPSSFTVANPTGREQLMQTVMLHGENPAATITEIKKNIDKYYAQLHEEDFQCLRLTDIFDRPHALGEIFFDATHFSHRANKMIAQRLFDHLQRSVRITGSRVTDEEIQEIQDHAKRNLRQVTIKHHFSDEMDRFLKEVKNSNFGGGEHWCHCDELQPVYPGTPAFN